MSNVCVWLLCRNVKFYRSLTQQQQKSIFSLIWPTKHVTLHIQVVGIKSLHTHRLTVITLTISPASIFKGAGCLFELIFCLHLYTSKLMTSQMRLSLQAWTPSPALIDDALLVLWALNGCLGIKLSSRAFSIISIAEFLLQISMISSLWLILQACEFNAFTSATPRKNVNCWFGHHLFNQEYWLVHVANICIIYPVFWLVTAWIWLHIRPLFYGSTWQPPEDLVMLHWM